MDLLKLQNGSDIRGIALKGIPGEEVNLTPDTARKIALSFSQWLSKKINKPVNRLKISLGRDPRLSGPGLLEAMAHGFLKAGCEVWDYELASTPAMFMSTLMEYMDGAVMITASHLPFNRNGMKFFHRNGGLEKGDITEILTQAGRVAMDETKQMGRLHKKDFMKEYAGYLRDFIRRSSGDTVDPQRPLKGTKILVDAGNGSGGFFASQVLEPLGADVSGSLFLDPDGRFPHHVPNPENNEALEDISEAVMQKQATLGIIFDTDVDRAALIGHDGKPINRNALIALVSAIVLEQYPGSWVVTDSITSDGLTTFIEKQLGGHHHRFKRGYRNVINEAIRLNENGKETHLAIETSGHAALKENYWLDDGAYLVALMLAKMSHLREEGRHPEDLISSLPHPFEEKEFRLRILNDDFITYGQQVLNDLRKFTKEQMGWQIVKNNYEGIRVACDPGHGDGWFLLRLSLHDPVLPLNAESNTAGGIRYMVKQIKKFFKSFDKLDTSPLDTFLST